MNSIGLDQQAPRVPEPEGSNGIETKLLAVTQWLLRHLLATAQQRRGWGNITYQQYNAMRVIALSGRASQTEIAKRLMVTAPAVTRLVASLVDAGMVDRHDDPVDRRTVLLSLTPQGRGRVVRMRRDLISAADDLLAGLERFERDELERVLDRLQQIRAEVT